MHQSAYNLRDLARQHHLERAKICSKLIKYPNIEDYTACCFFCATFDPANIMA